MAEAHTHGHGHSLGYTFTHPHQIPQQQQVGPVVQTHQTRGRGGGGGGGGEIVAVQGGHIVRSTGRKDRHSKVCTAKGPRDRRVRLSAHTAIQFYDVQDRLGYDRPSKAVDWLIKNAKDAIDKLAELPAWTPSTASAAGTTAAAAVQQENQQLIAGITPSSTFDYAGGGGGGSGSGGLLPPSLDSDAIADTIKSFFPMGGGRASTSATAPAPAPAQARSICFQSYTPEPLSRTGSQSQDLRLSLQSFQDSIYQNPHQHQSPTFAGSANLGFNSGSGSTLWPEPNQRIIPWNVVETGGGSSGGGGSGGYTYHMPHQTPQQAVPMHTELGQGQLFIQRGPLQSSNSPSVRAWAEPIQPESDQMHQGVYHSVQSIGFGSGSAGFSGFRIPARIQGEEEEHGGITDKPPSASSASRH